MTRSNLHNEYNNICRCSFCIEKNVCRAGLLVINDNKESFIINRRQSYNETYLNNWRTCNNMFFWEKIQIPRGKSKKNESLLECAIREFVEETGVILLGNGFLYKKPFILYWIDDNKRWEYKIYLLYWNTDSKFNSSNFLKVKKIFHNDDNFQITLSNDKYTSKKDIKSIERERKLFYNTKLHICDYIKTLNNVLRNNEHIVNNYYDFIKHVFTFLKDINNLHSNNFFYTSIY
ncbi:nudix domain protein [Leptopilina boulardi filamentous virus]|uniref:Nudix domain protein n=1 Tax=Leptopilina boulardi filamentous virus TaxID=552509 RepID=A0A1S5YD79_9VIRU|nr:nudix domain protein [Leptopilina boulardi filamentous virus]AQQ79957.1 nudix domain protein [Leptopilina boulardi filamentous virus]